MSKNIVVIAHNIRSTHNIGSIFRTCDGFGVNKIFLTGYTPYPKSQNDDRLPHLANKINNQIHKTALGAENSVAWEKNDSAKELITGLIDNGYEIIALEQSDDSINLDKYSAPDKVAMVIGEEVNGINKDLLNLCDKIVEIPMSGQKESFNVSVATGVALYRLRF